MLLVTVTKDREEKRWRRWPETELEREGARHRREEAAGEDALPVRNARVHHPRHHQGESETYVLVSDRRQQ